MSLIARFAAVFLLAFSLPAAAVVPPPPPIAAKSWVLMDAASGNVLAEHDGDARLPPASLTKMMTAYIATLEMQRGSAVSRVKRWKNSF